MVTAQRPAPPRSRLRRRGPAQRSGWRPSTARRVSPIDASTSLSSKRTARWRPPPGRPRASPQSPRRRPRAARAVAGLAARSAVLNVRGASYVAVDDRRQIGHDSADVVAVVQVEPRIVPGRASSPQSPSMKPGPAMANDSVDGSSTRSNGVRTIPTIVASPSGRASHDSNDSSPDSGARIPTSNPHFWAARSLTMISVLAPALG